MIKIVRFCDEEASVQYGFMVDDNRIFCGCCGGEFDLEDVSDVECLMDWDSYMRDYLEEIFASAPDELIKKIEFLEK